MRKNISNFYLPFLLISFFFNSCKTKSSEDILANRMAASQSFKEVLNFGKQMAGHVKQWPDSIRDKMLKLKKELELFQKNDKLNVFQKRDSILKRITIIDKMDSGLINQSKGADTIYKRFFADFPEFKKLSKED